MNEEIKNEILAVRETGATNMFDVGTVKEVYCKFILTGK